MNPDVLPETDPLAGARDEFVAQWGAMGTAWGINRTMAQIHALLITVPGSMTTDEIMADLKISRGNAHGNLRELISWGLVRNVIRKGERKEYFEAEKDAWKMFCIIMRERSRREIRPAISVLQNCAARTRGLKSPEAAAFNAQLKGLTDFLQLADNLTAKVSGSEQNRVVPFALRFLK